MRCASCNKFVSFDTESDPEVENLEVDDEGNVSMSVRIVNTCAECGDEMTEASMDIEVERDAYCQDWDEHIKEKHEANEEGEIPEGKEPVLEVSEAGSERTSRSEGKGRGMKTFYGAKIDFEVKCKCEWTATGTAEDDVQASSMDELQ